jgi:hypothetical protein
MIFGENISPGLMLVIVVQSRFARSLLILIWVGPQLVEFSMI